MEKPRQFRQGILLEKNVLDANCVTLYVRKNALIYLQFRLLSTRIIVCIAEDVQKFAGGLEIGEKKPTLPACLKILSLEAEASLVELTITEGKFHQVKRMFEAVEKKVLYLKRIAMGELKLDEALQPGEYRELTEEELMSLRKSTMQ